jgi:hypothetical protein
MHKNIMEKWVEALRSGKYRKGRGVLTEVKKNGTKNYCCLGVLCELYMEENNLPIRIGPQVSARSRDRMIVYYDEYDKFLPYEVRKWAGMDSRLGESNCGSVSLWFLNDNPKAKRSFKRMADIIEKNWSIL